MFAKRVRLEMAPAKWQGRALIFSLLAAGRSALLFGRNLLIRFGEPAVPAHLSCSGRGLCGFLAIPRPRSQTWSNPAPVREDFSR
jgi:hypothetical protein